MRRSARLEGAAPQDPRAARPARRARSTAHRARNPPARRGRPIAPTDACAARPLALVADTRRSRVDSRPGSSVARLRAALRPGTPLPLPQTIAQLDAAARAPPRTGRPLDLARRAGLHAGASGSTARARPAAAVATDPAAWQTHPDTRPTGDFAPGATAADSGSRAQNLWMLSLTSPRQALRPGDALSRHD